MRPQRPERPSSARNFKPAEASEPRPVLFWDQGLAQMMATSTPSHEAVVSPLMLGACEGPRQSALMSVSPASQEAVAPVTRRHDMPASPLGPVGPTAPAGPTSPFGPAGPAGPARPAGPAGPVSPLGPAGPAGPATPWSPFGPDRRWPPSAPQNIQPEKQTFQQSTQNAATSSTYPHHRQVFVLVHVKFRLLSGVVTPIRLTDPPPGGTPDMRICQQVDEVRVQACGCSLFCHDEESRWSRANFQGARERDREATNAGKEIGGNRPLSRSSASGASRLARTAAIPVAAVTDPGSRSIA